MGELNLNKLQLKIDKLQKEAWDIRYSNAKRMFKLCTETYVLSQKISYQIGEGRSLTLLGVYYYIAGDADNCYFNLSEALSIVKSYDTDVWNARILNMFGNYYSLIGRYETSLKYFMEGISILNDQNDNITYLSLLNNISYLYYRAGNYEQAFKYINQLIDYENNNTYSLKVGLITQSEIYLSTQNYEEALNSIYKVINLLTPKKDTYWLSICYTYLGSAYLGLNQFENSYSFLIKAFKLCKQQGQIQPLVIVNTKLGEYYLKTASYEKAESYLINAINIAEASILQKETIEACFLLADVYNAVDNAENEVFYYKKAVKLKKEHHSKELEDRITTAKLELKLKQSQKDSEIYRLKNIELKQKSEELEKKNTELMETLQKLQLTHEQLIQSEKMASLGQIVTIIGEQINSPIEKIQTAANNILEYLSYLNKDISNIFATLSKKEQLLFFDLVITLYSKNQKLLSSEEKLQIKKDLVKFLENNSLKNTASIADILINMGIYEDINKYLPILDSDKDFVLNAALRLSNLKYNSQNIEVEVNRASKIVFALKNYAYSNQEAKSIKASKDGIEIVTLPTDNHI